MPTVMSASAIARSMSGPGSLKNETFPRSFSFCISGEFLKASFQSFGTTMFISDSLFPDVGGLDAEYAAVAEVAAVRLFPVVLHAHAAVVVPRPLGLHVHH